MFPGRRFRRRGHLGLACSAHRNVRHGFPNGGIEYQVVDGDRGLERESLIIDRNISAEGSSALLGEESR